MELRTPRTSDEVLLCAEHAITQNSFSDRYGRWTSCLRR